MPVSALNLSAARWARGRVVIVTAIGALLATSLVSTPVLVAQSSEQATTQSTEQSSTKSSTKSSMSKAGTSTKPAKGTKQAAKSSKKVAQSTATADTGKAPRKPTGALGPQAGDRHLAFKNTGSDLDSLWPPTMPAPLPGSILPSKRIIAFYGNPRSVRMGILGEFAPDEMLRKLDAEVAEWNRLDPKTPVQPALHLIAVVAAGDKGFDGKYRNRMDSTLIEKVYGWAKSRNAIMFLDVQVGLSTLQEELPRLERFLKRPDVHLGIDPEFSMKDGTRPGKKIGTYDAADINYASRYLAELVEKNKLPPKVLVIHRFTQRGVTNAKSIRLDPKVQIVMHMDGFGPPSLKRDSYYSYIKKEPVQFAGWKQFTKAKNDKPTTPRSEILRLWPVPLYIQVQ